MVLVRVFAAGLAVLAMLGQACAETLTFDKETVGKPPAGFVVALTGGGVPPVWVVQTGPEPRSGLVVAQTSADRTSYRFPLLILEKLVTADVDLSVKFRPVGGAEDQAAEGNQQSPGQ